MIFLTSLCFLFPVRAASVPELEFFCFLCFFVPFRDALLSGPLLLEFSVWGVSSFCSSSASVMIYSFSSFFPLEFFVSIMMYWNVSF